MPYRLARRRELIANCPKVRVRQRQDRIDPEMAIDIEHRCRAIRIGLLVMGCPAQQSA